MSQCPECAAPTQDAPWCGSCGARLDAQRQDTPRRLPLVLVGLAAAVLVLALGFSDQIADDQPLDGQPADDGAAIGPEPLEENVVVAPAPPSPGPPVGRRFAATAATLWERTDVPPVPVPPDAVVTAAGGGHVLVGERLVPTAPGETSAADLRALPPSVATSAITADGGWAVGELGWLVRGSTGTALTTSASVAGPWKPAGGAIAWRDGEPVLLGSEGRLGRVATDGTARWLTAEPVRPDGPVGDRWLTARREDGSPVAVSLDDGRLVELEVLPLALHGDLAVLRLDGVVGRDLPTGATRWEVDDTGAAWRRVGDHLVAIDGGAVRVDPGTGAERGRVAGTAPVAAGEVVVDRVRSGLRATRWDGTPAWTLPLDGAATHAVLAVDQDRVAVQSRTAGRVRVRVLRAGDGELLADVPATPDRRSLGLAVDDGVVVLSTGDGRSWAVDAATGDDVVAPQPPPTSQELVFGSGENAVAVEVGVATLRGSVAGETRWTTHLDAPRATPAVRAGTGIVVGLADDRVAAIDPPSGVSWWVQDLEVLPTAVAGDGMVLLVGTADGRVLRLDPDGRPVTSVDLGEGPVLALAAGRPAAALLADRLVGFDVVP